MAVSLNHRIRICRLMLLVLITLNDQDQLYNFLNSLTTIEIQNLYHLLQTLVYERSLIERQSYYTYEQVASGIDVYTVRNKIISIVKTSLHLHFKVVTGSKTMGKLLSTYFKGHFTLNFDLLMNALFIHYEIPSNVQTQFAEVLKEVFRIKGSKHNVLV